MFYQGGKCSHLFGGRVISKRKCQHMDVLRGAVVENRLAELPLEDRRMGEIGGRVYRVFGAMFYARAAILARTAEGGARGGEVSVTN